MNEKPQMMYLTNALEKWSVVDHVEYIRADLLPQWLPIEIAPATGKFIALKEGNEVMTVERYNSPHGYLNTVINRMTGKWFTASYWAPLPELPHG